MKKQTQMSRLRASTLVLVMSGLAAACSDDTGAGGGPGDGGSGGGVTNAGAGGSGASDPNGGGGETATTGGSPATGGGGAESTGGAPNGGGGTDANGGGGADAGGGGAMDDGGGGSGPDPQTLDQDLDGWTPLDGDCCDTPFDCVGPDVVNPGAFEYPGNGVDDDCDPSTSDLVAQADCSPAALATPTSASDLLRAMDLCRTADESPTLANKKWGVISSSLLLADQSTALSAGDNVQVGVLANYGQYVTPRKGGTMAALSSGTARDPGDAGYVHPQNGPNANQVGNYNAQTQVAAPASFLGPNGGKFPSPANCPACNGAACTQAYDSVALRARIRVPTNAKSFSYRVKFYSSEFPEFLCQSYNDFFVSLLNSSWVPDPQAMPPQLPLPADGNIAIDSQGGELSVNNGFFQVCFPPLGSSAGTCPSGTLELVETGMGGWGNTLTDGGGTEWLVNSAPVVPGEIIDIDFMVWDAGDHNVDSLVLLDGFRWSVDASPVGLSK